MTPHFPFDELTFSQTAIRAGIKNEPNKTERENLYVLAQMLEAIRVILGHNPMHSNSGFRCYDLNTLLGGSVTSQHMTGCADDFTCRKYGDPKKICKRIVDSDIGFDQLINEGRWVHVSWALHPRRSILTASFGKDGVNYHDGIV